MGRFICIEEISALINRIKDKIDRFARFQHLEIYELDNVKDRVFFNEKQTDGSIIARKVNLIEYSPDKLVMELNSKNSGVLEISNNFHPNWKATVNGSPRQVFKSRTAFQGIDIRSSGNKHVILEYIDKPLKYLSWFCQPFALFLIALFYRNTKFFAENPKRSL